MSLNDRAPTLAPSPTARRAFRVLSWGVAAVAIALPTLATGYWLTERTTTLQSNSLRAVAIATALLHLLPLSWGLMRLRVYLAQLVSGHPFDARGIAGLRDFAIGTGLGALAKPVSGAILSLALTWRNPSRQLSIEISSDVMILALFAAVIASLAWVMQRAAQIAEENSQFV